MDWLLYAGIGLIAAWFLAPSNSDKEKENSNGLDSQGNRVRGGGGTGDSVHCDADSRHPENLPGRLDNPPPKIVPEPGTSASTDPPTLDSLTQTPPLADKADSGAEK